MLEKIDDCVTIIQYYNNDAIKCYDGPPQNVLTRVRSDRVREISSSLSNQTTY